MAGPRRWLVGAAGVLVVALLVCAADGPKPLVGPPDPPPKMPRADTDLVGPDGLQLPADAKAVVLPRDKFQEIMDELARLREQVKPAKPLAPSFCNVSGQVDGEIVRLHILFKFRTERDQQRVALGCAAGNPTNAKLDEQLPNFSKTTESGFVVQVEKAGEHKFQLELEVAVVVKEAERSFVLELPGAAVTSLELDLPDGVKTARVGSDTMKTEPTETKHSRVKGPLGPTPKLDVAWTLPATGTPSAPSLAVDTHITVRVEETQIVTEAELKLKAVAGEPTEWTLLAPAKAELRKQGPDDPIHAVKDEDPKQPFRSFKVLVPAAKDLKIGFRINEPRVNGRIAIGQFAVLGATQNQGTLLVSAPREVSLTYHPYGDVKQRTVALQERLRDPNLAAAFNFSAVPDLNNSGAEAKPNAPPLLDLDIETIKGTVDARVKYELRLVKPDEDTRPVWRLTATIEGASHFTRAANLRVQLPVGFQFDEKVGTQPADAVQGPEINAATRVATFTLFQKSPDRFQVIFQGVYAPAAEEEHGASLDLPLLLGVLDQGATVSISVPEDWKLAAPRMVGWRENVTLETHKQFWRYEQIPSQIALEWEPLRSDSGAQKTSLVGKTLRIERALIQATIGNSGFQNYRAWFLLRTGGARTLDVELPAPLAGINLRIELDGRPAAPMALDENGKPSDMGRMARISLGASADSAPVILRVEYQLAPGRSGSGGLLQSALQPPIVRAEAGWNPVRWQVALPSAWLPIDADAAFQADQQWGWRGWLWCMRPALSNGDAEGWSMGPDAVGMPLTPEGETAGSPALVGWQTTAGPLRFTHAPQQGWLLACSLTVLAGGLGASLLRWPHGLAWALALSMALVAAGVGLIWPNTLLSIVYGCEPGIVVLLLVFGAQWLLHQRYRRQVVFLPGFKRSKGGSALVRAGSSNRPRVGEPSTVDAPKPVGGSNPRTTGSLANAESGSQVRPVGDPGNP
jgi:hypothetical protein